MQFIVQDRDCPDCEGEGIIPHWDIDPQNEWDDNCPRCLGIGKVEHIAYAP